MKKIPLTYAALLCAPVWANEGHGLGAGSHWHASDALGFAIAIGLGLVLWAVSNRK
jgi:hypothetical protein